jgi:hypothetical protein
MMLSDIAQPVDRLQDECQSLGEMLDLPIAQGAPNARVETDRLLRPLLANPTAR